MIVKKKIKAFGNLNNIKLNITLPIEMNSDIDINKLTLMTGKNGSGKSLILKLSWLMTIYASIDLIINKEIKKES